MLARSLPGRPKLLPSSCTTERPPSTTTPTTHHIFRSTPTSHTPVCYTKFCLRLFYALRNSFLTPLYPPSRHPDPWSPSPGPCSSLT